MGGDQASKLVLANASGETPLLAEARPYSQPRYSPDGEGKFKVAGVSATPTFHVTSRADFMDDKYLPSVAPHANYDVSPDGTQLLVLKGERQRLLVVHNWGAEARAMLRGREQR